MRAFLSTLSGDNSLKDEIAQHLGDQGLNEPSDLGFLCNAGGGVSEGLVRKGCPSSWCDAHFEILCRAVERQALERQGVVNLTLLNLDAPGGGESCIQGPAAMGSKRTFAPPGFDTPRPVGKEGGLRSKPSSASGVSASAFTPPTKTGREDGLFNKPLSASGVSASAFTPPNKTGREDSLHSKRLPQVGKHLGVSPPPSAPYHV